MAATKHDATAEWSDEPLEASDYPQLAAADRAAEQSQIVDAELPGETLLGVDTHLWGDAAVVWVSIDHE